MEWTQFNVESRPHYGACSAISLAKSPKIIFLEEYFKLTISVTCVRKPIDYCTHYFMEIPVYNNLDKWTTK